MLVVALLSMIIPIWLNRQIGCYNLDRNKNTFTNKDVDAVKEQVKSSTGFTVSIISPNIGDVLTKDSVIRVQATIGGEDDDGTDVDDLKASKLSKHQSVLEANMGKSDYEQGPTIAGLQTTVAEQGTMIVGLQTTVAEQGTIIAGLQTTNVGLQTTNIGLQTTVAEQNKTIAEQGKTIAEQGTMIVGLQTTIVGLQTTVVGLQTTVAEQGTIIADLQTTNVGLQTTVAEQGTYLRRAAVIKAADEILFVLRDANSRWQLEKSSRISSSVKMSLKKMRNLRNSSAHFISSDDDDEVAAFKAKVFAEILGALTTEVTQRLKQIGLSDIDAIVQAVRENLSAFSEVTVSEEIAADASVFFESTLYVLGKGTTTENK